MKTLTLELASATRRRLFDAMQFLREQQGDDAAKLFLERVNEQFQKAREQITQEIESNEYGTPNRLPDEDASKLYFQAVYRLNIETAKRRRGSSTGLYYAYYMLEDRAGTGKPDTMHILTFRHSASRPLGQDSDDDAE